MSISGVIPIRDRERAVQDELRREGKPIKTGELTKRVLARFTPKLAPAELARVTPLGYEWWPGCIRLDLNRLQKKGKVRRHGWGYWEIVNKNTKGSTALTLERIARQQLNSLEEIVRKLKSEDIPFSITINNSEITLKLGETIKSPVFDTAQ